MAHELTLSTGVYQLGGRPGGYIGGNSSFWSGTMYYALFYSTELTAAQVAQNYNAVSQIMANRAVTPVGSTFSGNLYVIDGDSLPGANGAWFYAAFPTSANGAWQALYSGIPGYASSSLITLGQYRDDQYLPSSPGAGLAILDTQIGTNNLAGSLPTFFQQYAMFIEQRRKAGWTQVWIDTVLDRSGSSASKNTFNTALRQSWQTLGATGIVDIGGDPNLGCDGCNAGQLLRHLFWSPTDTKTSVPRAIRITMTRSMSPSVLRRT